MNTIKKIWKWLTTHPFPVDGPRPSTALRIDPPSACCGKHMMQVYGTADLRFRCPCGNEFGWPVMSL